jgi:hypothetical protein
MVLPFITNPRSFSLGQSQAPKIVCPLPSPKTQGGGMGFALIPPTEDRGLVTDNPHFLANLNMPLLFFSYHVQRASSFKPRYLNFIVGMVQFYFFFAAVFMIEDKG